MTMYLRQVCLVAQKLEPAIVALNFVLGIERCHVDPGVGKWGLENTLMAVGTSFLEVVAPIEENTAGGRYLDRRGGDGVWEPAGGNTWKDHMRSDVTTDLTGVELQSDDPQRDAKQWGAIAGITVEQSADGFRLLMANGELRFVPDRDGRSAGLAGVDLTVIERQRILEAAGAIDGYRDDHCVELCGTRFYLKDRS